MKNNWSLKKSVPAGVLIAIAAYLYINMGKPIGALLFCFALYFICLFEFDLFTGKIGYLGVKKLGYCRMFIGNAIGVLIAVTLLRWNPGIIEAAAEIAEQKQALNPLLALVNGYFCGALMFLAVKSWQKEFTWGCFFCVAVFILCGFEHSIADMAYMAYAWKWSLNLIWIITGNILGAVSCRHFF